MTAHGNKRQHLSCRISCIGTRCRAIFTHTTHPHASFSMKTPTASIYKHEEQTHTLCRLSNHSASSDVLMTPSTSCCLPAMGIAARTLFACSLVTVGTVSLGVGSRSTLSCMKQCISRCWENRRVLFFRMAAPAVEKSLSEAADDATAPREEHATSYSTGNFSLYPRKKCCGCCLWFISAS